ncbi:hypothetical protein ACH42_17240 [Endozoicomonas sp. (ex Bugula neritina AB1)]|nr:hypothetical protein ACH42_17240 [Endozoicomonas sp. (ex Bugula neritina AB1)]
MGRIRTVKPELFLHDELYDAEKTSGLPVIRSFIGLFTVCDRQGRFVWKPRVLKTQIAPYDDLDFSQVMTALQKAGFIQKYTVYGKEYGHIPSWEEHQTINNREADSKIPTPYDSVVHAQDDSSTCTTTKPPYENKNSDAPLQDISMHKHAQGEGKGREGKGRGTGRGTGRGKEGELEGEKNCRADAQPVHNSEPVSGELLPVEQQGLSPAKKNKGISSEHVTEIFQFWQTTLNHPQSRLDEKRRKQIRAALKIGYSVDDLKTAILGCAMTPFNQGKNEQGQKYDGLHVILKNADQIDRFINTALNQGVINENRERYIEQHAPTGVSRPFTAKDFDVNDTEWAYTQEPDPGFN